MLSHLVSQLRMLAATGYKRSAHANRKWCVSRHGRGYNQPMLEWSGREEYFQVVLLWLISAVLVVEQSCTTKMSVRVRHEERAPKCLFVTSWDDDVHNLIT